MPRPQDAVPMRDSEVREVQLDLLDRLDAFCRRAGLPYYLCGGTLLGAVRHRGYIPWDDDIDLMMARHDYDRLRRELPLSPEGAGLTVHCSETQPGWPYPYMKVSDGRTRVVEEMRHDAVFGVNVDIFPLDGVARGRLGRRLDLLRVQLTRGLWILLSLAPREGRARRKRLLVRTVQTLLSRVPLTTATAAWSRAAQRRPLRPGDGVGFRAGMFDWSVPSAEMFPPSEVEFEGRSCQAPADPDAVLRAMFGDYMTLPPPEKQVSTHRSSAYWSSPQGSGR